MDVQWRRRIGCVEGFALLLYSGSEKEFTASKGCECTYIVTFSPAVPGRVVSVMDGVTLAGIGPGASNLRICGTLPIRACRDRF
jgi:hypothetical protein